MPFQALPNHVMPTEPSTCHPDRAKGERRDLMVDGMRFLTLGRVTRTLGSK